MLLSGLGYPALSQQFNIISTGTYYHNYHGIIFLCICQGRNYHEASEAVASSLKSRSSVLSTDTILASISRSHLLFHMTAVLPKLWLLLES